MKRLRFRLLLLMLALLPGLATHAAGPRVVVLPLEVFNAPDVEALSPGLQSMLASRLAAPVYSVTVSSDSENRAAEWVVRTTITRLGNVYSVDAAAEPLTAAGDGTRTYETANSPDELFSALEAVASRLKTDLERIASKVPAAPAAVPVGPPSTVSPAPQPVPVPAPQPVLAPPSPPSPPPAAPAPGVATRQLDEAERSLPAALRTVRVGPTFSGEAKSLAVADTNGDGISEILVLTKDEIRAFHDGEAGMVPVWQQPTPKDFDAMVLSAGDIDGNGRPEIVLAGMDRTWPVTEVLEWSGSALVPKGERLSAFARVVASPGDRSVLLGLVKGLGRNVFSPGIRNFVWDGTSYPERGRFPAPKSAAAAVNLNLFNLVVGQPPFAVVTSQMDRLEIYDAEGKRLYRGDELVMGSRNVIQGVESRPNNMDQDIVRVHGKVAGWQAPDGRVYIILPNNHGGFARFFNGEAPISNGNVSAFRWDELTLLPITESPKIPGFIPDLDVGPSPGRPGATTLYTPLVRAEGAIMKKMQTRILAYDLPGTLQ